MDQFYNFVDFVTSNFLDPKKRVFLGYLFSGFFIAFLWVLFVKKISFKQTFNYIFDKRIYFAKSAISDYFLYAINLFVMIIFSPILLSQLTIATVIFEFLHTQEFLIPIENIFVVSMIIPVAFTLCYFVVDDFSKFLVHMLMHKIPFLWCYHKVHHSAEVLTPITVFRTHPIEGFIFVLRNAITQGAVIGMFYFISNGNIDLVTVLGANIFSFCFHLFGSNLRHSHINICYWRWLEHFLISPAQHQIHHSVKKIHHDKNFGVTFAFWDLIFGSLVFSKINQQIKYGLSEKENYIKHNIFQIYIFPIRESLNIIFTIFKKNIIRLYNFFYVSVFKFNKGF